MLYYLITKLPTCSGHSRAVWKPRTQKCWRNVDLILLLMVSIVPIRQERTPNLDETSIWSRFRHILPMVRGNTNGNSLEGII